MNELAKERAGMALAGFLAADALANLYWATGATWPAPDRLTLTLAILNGDYPTAPAVTVPLACLSLGGAFTALARVHRLGALRRLIPDSLLQVGALAIAGAPGVRGALGIGWALGLLPAKTQAFYALNLVAFTPACLVFCAAAVAAANSRRAKGKPADPALPVGS